MNNPKATTTTPKALSTKKTPVAKAAAPESKFAGAQTAPNTGRAAMLDSLRLDQSYMDPAFAVEDLLTSIEIGKPQKGEFVRVHPEFRFDTQVLDRGIDAGFYLVSRNVLPAVASDVVPVSLRLFTTRDGKFGLWPLKLQKGEKPNPWNVTAMACANAAVDAWVAMQNAGKHYVVRKALNDLGNPAWPTKTWEEILDVAFLGRYIETTDHVVIKQILGAK